MEAEAHVRVLGVAQNVEEIESPSYVLHDPFLSTTLDFMRRCLDQLSKALHVAVCHTYRSLPSQQQGTFFLASFSPWSEVKKDKAKRKNFNDPRLHESGRDIQWLLKNFQFHVKFYADKLGLSAEELEDMVSFLLHSIRNQIAHQYYLKKFEMNDPGNPWLRKYVLTSDCLSAASDLVCAIASSQFFDDVQDEISKIKRNLERMQNVFEEHKEYSERKKACERRDVKTEEVLSFLKSPLLENALRHELTKAASYKERPLSHFFQTVIMPRMLFLDDKS